MLALSKLISILANQLYLMGDYPLNILIGGQYYDIQEFYFDSKIFEYIMKIEGGNDFDTRAVAIPINIINQDIKRFMVDDAGSLIDMQTGKSYDYFEEVVGLMNQLNRCRNESIFNEKE